MGPLAALFWFTIRQTLFQRKIWPTVLLLAAPVAVVLLVRHFDTDSGFWERYHLPMMLIFFSLVMPLACLLYGSTLLGSEIEGRTLVYLLTRRLRRSTVLLTRFAATGLALIVLFELGAVIAFAGAFEYGGPPVTEPTAGMTPEPAATQPWSDLACHLYLIPLGTIAFLAVFTLIGFVLPRPMANSVGYFVMFELIMGNVPMRVQLYTVSHHLRTLMFHKIPGMADIYEMSPQMVEQLYPPGSTGIPVLIGVPLVALAVSCTLATLRELVAAKITRE